MRFLTPGSGKWLFLLVAVKMLWRACGYLPDVLYVGLVRLRGILASLMTVFDKYFLSLVM
jgi:hypothetical protein